MSSNAKCFNELPDMFNFPKNEEMVLKYWEEIDAFQTSLKQSEGKKRFTFYDGPPFATGLPHYGHILAGTIKDTVTRYAHQTGHHVDRRFGWDCHGLPVEHEIDKKLGIKGPEHVKEMGIAVYNNECRAIVDRYSNEWKSIMTRLGRWIDFDRDYKTMYPTYMESVWWVCKQLFEKNRIYHGYRVMPYSTACNTPLSNFEANQNYKEVADPSITVCFPLEDDPTVCLLAWTTTPWTLVSNLSLIVNPKCVYVKVEEIKTKCKFILMESRLSAYFGKKRPCIILEKYTGEQLQGKSYIPCFDYFIKWKECGAFRVLIDSYVTEDDGTGVVQSAPAFGEDDYRVSIKNGIYMEGNTVPCPIDEKGCFTKMIPQFQDIYFKDVDRLVIKSLKNQGRIFSDGTVCHNYPFCWRSDTPLMYRMVPSWFVKVNDIIPQLLANNSETNWVPEFVKTKRFHNWLENARDWNISRNRYWGTPIPLWVNSDLTEIVCVGSIEELYELSGVQVTDLHREFVDNIQIPSKNNPGTFLNRVPEVFDCWFESGSMPYAQIHYPFENKDVFNDGFPADFIAEGIDQTRGWFYTLLVIATSIFDKPPFKNLIVNGLVLASDGQKMSKRKQNYPDPMEIIDKHGSDVLRLYLINSPVVKAEFLKFQESGVRNLIKEMFLPWYNSFRYLMQNIALYSKYNNESTYMYEDRYISTLDNFMDKWIISYTQSLINFIHQEMSNYRLYTVVPKIIEFLDNLTKWYIRFNRKRLKGDKGSQEQIVALSTLFNVQYNMVKMFAPFVPFFTEYIFQNLVKYDSQYQQLTGLELEMKQSVHFQLLPQPILQYIDESVEQTVSNMQSVVNLARIVRERNTLPLKIRLKELVVLHTNLEFLSSIKMMESYILEDLNLLKLTLSNDMKSYGIECKVIPNYQQLGERLRKQMNDVKVALSKLSIDNIEHLQKQDATISISGSEIHRNEVKLLFSVKESGKYSAHSDGEVVILLDITQDEESMDQFAAREIVNRIQKLRKKANVQPTDDITIVCWGDENTCIMLNHHLEYVINQVKMPIVVTAKFDTSSNKVIDSTETILDNIIHIMIYK